MNVSGTSTFDESIQLQLQLQTAGRGTNPLRSVATEAKPDAHRRLGSIPQTELSAAASSITAPAIARQSAQLPTFAPLLDELEIAGWSSHRRMLSGNFHDWLMIEGRTILAIAGHAVGPESIDNVEAALVAQAAWATIRAHASRAQDAGELLSLAANSLWRTTGESVQTAVVVAMLDTVEGHATIAMAGDCLVWRIRAAKLEQLAIRQPLLGGATNFNYASQFLQLSLRERLLFVADNPTQRPTKLAATVARSFGRLDAESHRRMVAADALAVVRNQYQQIATDVASPSASIVAVRRR
jgi:hypothetical protein